ncbi:tubulin-specific chaperone D [Octopus sinensis]|uniref:Tubulin-specific chaperone D n=1 Tax=Octopus sinensis TaxID=2607531 RepID=A0A6P7SDR1_9MOLL|nr:tubulin-specific chaperone D [Octopus sinensis]
MASSDVDGQCDKSKEDVAERRCLHMEKFAEATVLKDMLDELKNVGEDIRAQEVALQNFKAIIDRYQLQPAVMDPYLEGYINQLMGYIKDPNSSKVLFRLSFQHLYLISKMRSQKLLARYLPHEVTDLPFALKLLQAQDTEDRTTWETRYMLLLWLSIACMIPFDLNRLDTMTDGTKSVMDQILELSQSYVCKSDKCRDAAVYLLAKFMTRDDVKKKHLSSYLDWTCKIMHSSKLEEMDGKNPVVGIIWNLALLLKYGKREDLLEHAGYLLKNFSACSLSFTGDTLMRKAKIKFLQRLGLIFLKSRVASWRYARGCRSIAVNLATDVKMSSVQPAFVDTPTESEDNEEYDIPEEMEEIIEQLLNGLKDNDTVVRWSAAKGIGRITGRLPKELADEVVGSILVLFSNMEGEFAWHGGCMALAELGRRGLLLPQRLPEVMSVVRETLRYDVRHGKTSVGAPVRDAACYISWSFARAYDPKEMSPYVQQLASSLLIAAVFDRQSCIRKAAAAAFQENVGRQGSFPHGIDIVTVVDYYSVGSLQNCYLNLSIILAQYPEYRFHLIDHLVDIKIMHWDVAIRKLTAKALKLLVPFAPDYMAETVLPKVLSLTHVHDLTTQQGAILAVGEVTCGLASYGEKEGQRSIEDILGETTVECLRALVEKLEEAHSFRGVGGEHLQQTVANYIQNLSLAKLPFHNLPIIDVWQQFLFECLCKDQLEVQTAALECFPIFVFEYYQSRDGEVRTEKRDALLEHCVQELTSDWDYRRMSHALALGKLPLIFIKGKLDYILPSLCTAAELSDKPELWAEARSDAVKAINSLCLTVDIQQDGPSHTYICKDNLNLIYETFFDAIKDYTIDKRCGDIGAFVREAAMQSLHDLTCKITDVQPAMLSKDIVERTICSFAQQACEKIDRTRALASNLFLQLLHHTPPVPYIPQRDFLLEIFTKDRISNMRWHIQSDSFDLFASLLTIEVFSYHVLLGFIQSAGGLSQSLCVHSTKALDSYMQSEIVKDPKLTFFRKNLIEIFQTYQKVDRVTVPMLNLLGQLFDRQVFINYCKQPENEIFLKELLSLTKTEVSKSLQHNKLSSSIKVLCGLLQFSEPLRKDCLKQLGIFLCHQYPKIRLNTANELYDTLLLYDDILPEEHADDCMELIGETKWDQSREEIRPVRNQLWEMMDITPPVKKTASQS